MDSFLGDFFILFYFFLSQIPETNGVTGGSAGSRDGKGEAIWKGDIAKGAGARGLAIKRRREDEREKKWKRGKEGDGKGKGRWIRMNDRNGWIEKWKDGMKERMDK